MNPIRQLFPRRFVRAASPGEAEGAEPQEPASVPGERGIASVNQHRSLQSRISNLMAMGLMGAMGLGLLGWYYSQTYAHQREAKDQAQSATRTKAQGDMPLPALGRVDPPGFVRTGVQSSDSGGAFGGPPPLPQELRARPVAYAAPESAALAPGGYPGATPVGDRRLEGPVFASPGESDRRVAAAP